MEDFAVFGDNNEAFVFLDVSNVDHFVTREYFIREIEGVGGLENGQLEERD